MFKKLIGVAKWLRYSAGANNKTEWVENPLTGNRWSWKKKLDEVESEYFTEEHDRNITHGKKESDQD